MTIDAIVGGALMNKPYPEACTLIEDMAQSHYRSGTERTSVEKKETKGGMHEVSCLDHMKAQMNVLAQKVESLTINPTVAIDAVQPGCEICGTR